MKTLPNIFVLLIFALYFDFIPSSYLLSSSGEAHINFYHKVPESYLQNIRVKAKFYEGSGFILNPVTSNWINSESFWTEQPKLSSSTKIKTLGNRDVYSFSFLMQDTRSGIIYETPIKKFWTRNKLNTTASKLKLPKSFSKP